MKEILSAVTSVIPLLLCVVLQACNADNKNVLSSGPDTEYDEPRKVAVKWTTTDSIKFLPFDPDTVKPAISKPFSLAEFPTIDFVMDGFMPIDNVNYHPLVFGADSAFEYEGVPWEALTVKHVMLGNPVRVKASQPRILDHSTESIMNWTPEQGWPNVGVYSFAEDSSGIMYLSTEQGLCRFDGNEFHFFAKEQGLSGDRTMNLMFDKDNRLWLRSGKFINIINFEKGLIYEFQPVNNGSRSNYGDIHQSADGNIWITGDKGPIVISRDLTKFRAVGMHNPCISSGSNIASVGNELWFTNGQKVVVANVAKKTRKIIDLSPLCKEKFGFYDLDIDLKGNAWLTSLRNGFFCIDLKRSVIMTRTDPRDGYTVNWDILPDRAGNIWITSHGGMFCIDSSYRQMKIIRQSNGLSSDKSGLVFEDHDYQIWTEGTTGFSVIRPKTGRILRYGTAQGISDSWMRGIAEDNYGRKWIGSKGGLNIIDQKIQKMYRVPPTTFSDSLFYSILKTRAGHLWVATERNGIDIVDLEKGSIKNISVPQGLFSSYVTKMVEDHAGNIWVLTRSGLNILTPEGKVIKKLNYQAGNIFIDQKDRVFLSSRTLTVLDPEKKIGKVMITPQGWEDIYIDNAMVDSKNRTWLASRKGVAMIDEAQENIYHFSGERGSKAADAKALAEVNGRMLACSRSGLSVIEEINGNNSWKVISYGFSDGFPPGYIDANNILVTSNEIWYVLGEDLVVTDKPVKQENRHAAYITSLGINETDESFLLPAKTIQVVPPGDTLWAAARDTFYIAGRSEIPAARDKKWNDMAGVYNLPVDLSLPYNENHVTFRFSGLDPVAVGRLRFRYRLNGNEDQWSQVTNSTTAEYRNLDPGIYTFEVAATDGNGKWGVPALLSFKIRPPWWKTTLAYTAYAIAFIILIWTFNRSRARKLKKENKLLEDRVSQRTAELKVSIDNLKETQQQLIHAEKLASLGELTAGIAHEIQNPLNFINNFSEVTKELSAELKEELDMQNIAAAKEIADDITANAEKIVHHGQRADSIVKNMLQHSKTSSGKKEPTDINALADEYLRLSYHGLRAKDKSFNADFKTSFDNSVGKINVVPQDMGRVLLNLFNNAFYAVGEKKKQFDDSYKPMIEVSTERKSDTVIVHVKDNGTGIPQRVIDKIYQPFFTTKPTGEGTGLGLSMSYDIITKGHNGQLNVTSTEGEGTAFTIALPTK